jgi:uncharacterized RDD family membrane protein YckC
METISVRTTQNIDIEYEMGGLGERILALLIDYGIFIGLSIVGLVMLANAPGTAATVYFITIGVIFVFYDLVFETFFNGQSLGKKVMKIRVMSLNGARPKFSQYLLRWLFRMIDFGITGGICALVTAVMTDEGQRVGDIVAGTILIRTKPRANRGSIIFAPTEDGYQPVFTQVIQLTDKDVELIHEVIDNYFRTGNNELVYTIADRMRELLSINLPPDMNSMQFLQTLLKDYSHISSSSDLLINS